MNALALLAFTFGAVAVVGTAIVHLYDLLVARGEGVERAGGGTLPKQSWMSRRTRSLGPVGRGVLVTVRAGSAATGMRMAQVEQRAVVSDGSTRVSQHPSSRPRQHPA